MKTSEKYLVRPKSSFWSCFFGSTPGTEARSTGTAGKIGEGGPGGHLAVGKPLQDGAQVPQTAAVFAAAEHVGEEDSSNASPAGGAEPAYRPSADAPSTSYPTSCREGLDGLHAWMTTAAEMEACVDTVLDGSIKSAQTMFARYDMNLDGRLNQQDYYDMMLELNLALPVPDYQRFIDDTFYYADSDRDCLITVEDFIPVYKAIAAARRAFKHQDHHQNGQIDRYDFYQVLTELEVDGGEQGLKSLAEDAFRWADTTGRGIVNFGQMLVWYGSFLAGMGRQASSSMHGVSSSSAAAQ